MTKRTALVAPAQAVVPVAAEIGSVLTVAAASPATVAATAIPVMPALAGVLVISLVQEEASILA